MPHSKPLYSAGYLPIRSKVKSSRGLDEFSVGCGGVELTLAAEAAAAAAATAASVLRSLVEGALESAVWVGFIWKSQSTTFRVAVELCMFSSMRSMTMNLYDAISKCYTRLLGVPTVSRVRFSGK